MTTIEASRSTSFGLSSEEVTRFDTFGYLLLRDLFAEEIDDIRQGFESLIAETEPGVIRCDQFYDATSTGCETAPRLAVLGPVPRDAQLDWLREDPRVTAIASTLVPGEHEYAGSQANLFNCDVHWHNDGLFTGGAGRHILFMIYLDALTAGTGALRVLPASHLDGAFKQTLHSFAMGSRSAEQVFGLSAEQLPAHVLEVQPGDVIIIDFDTFHASFGGGIRRRSITMAFGPRIDGRQALQKEFELGL